MVHEIELVIDSEAGRFSHSVVDKCHYSWTESVCSSLDINYRRNKKGSREQDVCEDSWDMSPLQTNKAYPAFQHEVSLFSTSKQTLCDY